MNQNLMKAMILVVVPGISLITSGCQKLNMHQAPREDTYFSVPDHIPELEQKSVSDSDH
ncbi:MAG: hypothetical protein ABIK07_19560 [Planctomycetota bacterium]|uniref:hypothetical protein n=1 Tax=uncultured Gimesia sp. TaxID=1678688 RepID=UPI00262E1FDA|nr:hypothetical protein [uncultured Gimesia sp.]